VLLFCRFAKPFAASHISEGIIAAAADLTVAATFLPLTYVLAFNGKVSSMQEIAGSLGIDTAISIASTCCRLLLCGL